VSKKKKLRLIKKDIWESPKGLVNGYDRKFGDRVQHVLAHAEPNKKKLFHTIFNCAKNDILKLIDEAWSLKNLPLKEDPGAYVINMGRQIGTKGETGIKIIVKPGTSEIITAYPIKI